MAVYVIIGEVVIFDGYPGNILDPQYSVSPMQQPTNRKIFKFLGKCHSQGKKKLQYLYFLVKIFTLAHALCIYITSFDTFFLCLFSVNGLDDKKGKI